MRQITEAEFQRLVAFVRDGYGINLEKKKELVVSRLAFFISQQGYDSFTSYLDVVTQHPASIECQRMIDRLSTNHTFFFRETGCLKHFVATALPELEAKFVNPVRIWCAAASSGQECYTIAMWLLDVLPMMYPRLDFNILATDISSRVIEVGRRGIYSDKELEHIPAKYRNRFVKLLKDGTFEVSPEVRSHVTWQSANLVEPFKFMRPFDVIFCRNVMFYFLPDMRFGLLPKFYSVLRSGGYFYVGTTETIDREQRYFSYVAPSIYRKGG